jgi:hypothetical protein
MTNKAIAARPHLQEPLFMLIAASTAVEAPQELFGCTHAHVRANARHVLWRQ